MVRQGEKRDTRKQTQTASETKNGEKKKKDNKNNSPARSRGEKASTPPDHLRRTFKATEMDKDTFIMQLALLLSYGATSMVKEGQSYIIESEGKDANGNFQKVKIPQKQIPWFDELYKHYKKNNRGPTLR